MMISSVMFLFGLNLSPLYHAIAKVESANGITSTNVYQIGASYVKDVNQIYGLKNGFQYRILDVNDRCKSEMMMWLYWKHWGYQYARKTGKPITYEILVRMHNGGPNGWMKRATDRYWDKVKKEISHND